MTDKIMPPIKAGKSKTTAQTKTVNKAFSETAIASTGSIQIRQGNGFYHFSYAINLILLFTVGWTFCNLLHFCIEDIYNEPTQSSFLFGAEYAKSVSWLLLSSAVFMVLSFYLTRYLRRNPAFFADSERQTLLRTLLIAGLIFAFFTIIYIIYGFFSGHSDIYGLLRILVTMFVVFLGIGYTFIESRYEKFIIQNRYLAFLGVIISMVCLTGVVVTLKNASPQALKTYYQDASRVSDMKIIAGKVKDYYKTYKELPKTLQKLVDDGLINKKYLRAPTGEPYGYKPVSDRTFEMCTTFQQGDQLGRRLTYQHRVEHFEEGLQCRRVFIEKDDRGDYRLSFNPLTNIHINLNGVNGYNKQ